MFTYSIKMFSSIIWSFPSKIFISKTESFVDIQLTNKISHTSVTRQTGLISSVLSEEKLDVVSHLAGALASRDIHA